jgi:hypothetical protein
MKRLIYSTLICITLSSPAAAESPLREKIDMAVSKYQVLSNESLATDAEFQRRVYLDLLGTIPSAEETRSFLNDAAADKREQLANRIIADPRLNHRLANVFDVMLMERIADGQVKSAQWRQYLYDSFVANKPYNVLAREILASNGADPTSRPAARFYLDRAGETNRLTRDVGRMFFGMDMQCAQCHDHPLIDGYFQRDYYGLFAFLNRSHILTDAAKKNYFAEKSVGNVSFKSVFTEEAGETGPHLPGDAPIAEPVHKKIDEYKVRPRANVVTVPTYSRREQLAETATNGKNRAFNRNIANRLWGLMNGRALVTPVDLQHSGNPPLNPELMSVLEAGIVQLNFDVKMFLREIALSKTYQRAYQLESDVKVTAAHIQTKLDSVETAQNELSKQVIAASQAWREQVVIAKLDTQWTEIRAAYVKADKAASAKLDKYLKEDGSRVTAANNISLNSPKRDVLATAAAEIDVALKLLPAEKELVDAAATFKKKLDASNAALAKLEATRVKAEGKAQEELAGLSPLQIALDTAWQVWEPGKIKLQAAAAKEQVLRNAYEKIQAEFYAMDAQKLRWKRIQSAALLDEQVVSQQMQLVALQRKIKQSTDQVNADKQELAKLQSNQQSAQQTHQQVMRALTGVEKQRASKKEAIELMDKLITTTNAAIKSIPTDDDALAVVSQLKQQQSRLGSQMAEVDKNVKIAQTEVSVKAKQLQSAVTAVTEMQKTLDAKLTTLQTQQQQLATEQPVLVNTREKQAEAQEKLSSVLVYEFVVSDLKPLTPEQLANAIMESLGVTETFRVQVDAEVAKANPLTDMDKQDAVKLATRQREVSEKVQAKITSLENEFIKLYAAGAGQVQTDFFATIDQALYFTNGGRIKVWVNSNSYLAESSGSLGGRLIKTESALEIAEQLYISLLNRRPTAQETKQVNEYLTARADQKAEIVREMIWALLASTEFRFNH